MLDLLALSLDLWTFAFFSSDNIARKNGEFNLANSRKLHLGSDKPSALGLLTVSAFGKIVDCVQFLRILF